MLNDKQHSAERSLWLAWLGLVALSVLLLMVGLLSTSRIVVILVSVLGMLVMAWLIVSRFMHLRSETPALTIAIIMCTLGLGATLFLTLVPDSLRILHHLAR
jgi:cytochrome c oxidase subunit IV